MQTGARIENGSKIWMYFIRITIMILIAWATYITKSILNIEKEMPLVMFRLDEMSNNMDYITAKLDNMEIKQNK